MWNMKLTVIPIIVSTLGTVLKGWEKRLAKLEIRGRIETIWTKALLSSGDLRRLAATQTLVIRLPADVGRKNLQEVK